MTTRWHKSALDYITAWMNFQIRQMEQPGCAIAVAYRGRLLLEQAFVIDLEVTVRQMLEAAAKDIGAPIEVTGFVRFALGEGIE